MQDHERSYFDSADWVLGKQGTSAKSNTAVESLKPKLKVFLYLTVLLVSNFQDLPSHLLVWLLCYRRSSALLTISFHPEGRLALPVSKMQ
ncbi:hypothetical protein ZIOFF_045984 [Zingiber officinale]|uniref:Uncharacterized protein n=1 Tax=Zingiber officinale TaxID=94328 RepID=A0A8J5G072_ZINOF|nr:hypothetical protein ZIOFF_045984 [Zingiber officinale]